MDGTVVMISTSQSREFGWGMKLNDDQPKEINKDRRRDSEYLQTMCWEEQQRNIVPSCHLFVRYGTVVTTMDTGLAIKWLCCNWKTAWIACKPSMVMSWRQVLIWWSPSGTIYHPPTLQWFWYTISVCSLRCWDYSKEMVRVAAAVFVVTQISWLTFKWVYNLVTQLII